MAASMRLGVQVPPADPFWVQMREGIVQQAQQMGLDIIPIELDAADLRSPEQEAAALELILAQEIDAVISHLFPVSFLQRVLGAAIPVIYLYEHALRHERFVSTTGMYESAQIAVRHLAERIGGRGSVLLIGEFQTGRSRLDGACDVLREFPSIAQYHLPCPWNEEQARTVLPEAMRAIGVPLDAIFGFSDGLALLGREVGCALGLVSPQTVVVGIDGDPLAIAAIADGSMAATVELAPMDLGRRAVELASQAVRGVPLPAHYRYQPRLVTAQNVAEVAARKLIAMAHLPSRLVGVNRHQERQQLAQLEASQAINRQVTAILERRALPGAISRLIRDRCGYDGVRLLRWDATLAALLDEQSAALIALEPDGLLAQCLQRDEALFVPDMQRSHRFAPDDAWPDTVSRVVVPIHVGARITGVLDLHSTSSRPHTRQELSGLQLLADQLGTALRNAELYEDAVGARSAAERADALKTRLLANVSHELRTPLNVILGYTETILAQPERYAPGLPASLLRDVRHVYQSGEHLIRLINDLLDLARAESGALDIFPELLDPRALLADVFGSMAAHDAGDSPVRWRLDLPPHLPLLQADPVRVRQIVLNLLSNAAKFTASGTITLGARVEPPCLQLWVADTGSGIAPALHEQIFEPFVTGHIAGRSGQGIGLGLSIVRQLVALHGGTLRLDSQPGRGSTFHVTLPLPSLHGGALAGSALRAPAMLLVAAPDDGALARLCRRQELTPYHVAPDEQIEPLFTTLQPVALLCNVDRARAHDWALIEQIRKHPQGAVLPFLLYSPRDMASDGDGWLTRVLVKPFRSTELLQLIAGLDVGQSAGPVLIVDDDSEICAFYQQLVASALPATPVRVALGGAAALALLAHEVPSLVILDLVMPGVDGFEVVEQLRASERTRHVPVLVLSGKLLSAEDVQRLSYHQVVVHGKQLLTDDELAAQLQRAHSGAHGQSAQTSRLVKQATAYMQEHHSRPLSRQEIADALGINQSYLSEIFQHELGLSLWDYLNRYRISRAKALLQDNRRTVSEVATSVGFNDPSYFGRLFRRIVGCSPQQFRSTSGL